MPSRFTKKDSGVNEKTNSVFDNIWSKYNLLCLYIAAYPTLKEKTVVIIISIHYQPNSL